jgi:hypothetical protein
MVSFCCPFTPNLVLTHLLLDMGAIRLNFTKLSPPFWADKTVMTLLLAFLGYWGLRYLLHFLGVFNAL